MTKSQDFLNSEISQRLSRQEYNLVTHKRKNWQKKLIESYQSRIRAVMMFINDEEILERCKATIANLEAQL